MIMETEMEEQSYGKILYLLAGILAVIIIGIVLDIMMGGRIISSLCSAMTWYIPITGPVTTGYVDCNKIPF
jgi:hypothetical protein